MPEGTSEAVTAICGLLSGLGKLIMSTRSPNGKFGPSLRAVIKQAHVVPEAGKADSLCSSAYHSPQLHQLSSSIA